MMRILLACLLSMLSLGAWADTVEGPKVVGETFEYSTGGETYQGYLARNVNDEEPRPAVLLVHEWWGLNDYAKSRADQLAALGFVALAVDMYGEGKNAQHPDDAQAFSKRVMSDWPTARASLEAAMAKLREQPYVRGDRMAALGYCFGGGVVMNMALAGMPIEAAISFHGSPTQAVSDPQPFDGIVQIHNGEADGLVESDALESMAQTLSDQGAEVRVVQYPGAKHGFSNPGADAKADEFDLPLGYDAAADAASWQSALVALDRALNKD
ncbi:MULTISPECIES: dienelactone hydrolase family protein [Chromohalobacter]|uniref:Dienelactone hydrolase family protein n=2 Tax=Chromohalobacter TaxID=42054 RepID=A0A9X2WZP8_9GAMM|nr:MULTISPECIES: dienelactone hydrolase family protein [Chromohalobacter]MCK0768448.1 dienelactone hydrolase family protein [Chromohalobacter canadensis]MCK2044429.1 dienelactone hydrolase family protein [Chromohalobacter moromii]MCT8467410.1 dienelactone hydrolase family protein [Chromohalobacter canadensis]MCT8470842.1 dienelactone hydrolase family protein [Chromohalobacter canadensis]MCT8497907.1 dienelactone hydrolase family protein [Chromohalobacter canadensis]